MPVRYAVRHLILTPLCASVPLCLCVNFITETQRHRVFFILLCPSAPLPLCVKIILSQSRDSFPNLVNPVNPVKKVRLSEPLCLCVNFITETQRHRDTEVSSSSSAPLLLCPSALKFFYRRIEIHFLILSILLILSKK